MLLVIVYFPPLVICLQSVCYKVFIVCLMLELISDSFFALTHVSCFCSLSVLLFLFLLSVCPSTVPYVRACVYACVAGWEWRPELLLQSRRGGHRSIFPGTVHRDHHTGSILCRNRSRWLCQEPGMDAWNPLKCHCNTPPETVSGPGKKGCNPFFPIPGQVHCERFYIKP